MAKIEKAELKVENPDQAYSTQSAPSTSAIAMSREQMS